MAREYFSRNWDRMPLEEQREYRDRKLNYFVRTRLYPYSEFYRKLFDENKVKPEDIRGVQDLRKLPFTYKSDIAPAEDNPYLYERFVLKPSEESMAEFMPRMSYWKTRYNKLLKGEDYVKESVDEEYEPVHVQFTTGRTGLPTPIMYGRSDLERMAEAGRRVLELSGFGTRLEASGSTVLNAMPFAPHLGFWMTVEGLQRAGLLALHTGGGRIMGTRRIIGAAQSTKPTAIIGMPGYIYHLLRTALELETDLSSVKLVILAGDRIPKGMKDRLTELLEQMGASDVVVSGTFGFTEGRKAYSECVPETDTGYHLYPDMDYFELIDPETEEPVTEGEDGELVYTCLDGRGTCVVRFRTGDFVKGGIVNEPCPQCGRRVPRLGSDISRTGKVKGFSLIKLKGALVDQCAFQSILDGNPKVGEWQVEISKAQDDPFEVDVLDVYATIEQGADEESVRGEIDAAFLLETEVRPNSVSFLAPEDLIDRLRTKGGMKELHVVDSRPDL